MEVKTNNSTLVFEFLGLPGSGKSTIQNHLKNECTFDGMTILTKKDLSIWLMQQPKKKKLFFIAKKLNFAVSLLIKILTTTNIYSLQKKETIVRLTGIIKETVYIRCFVESKKPDVLILDQSLLHGLWSLWFGYPTPKSLALKNILTYANRGINKEYIFLEVEPDTSVKRLLKREPSKSRFDGIANYQEVKRLINKGRDANTFIHQTLLEYGFNLKVVSANANFNIYSDEVFQWIINCYKVNLDLVHKD